MDAAVSLASAAETPHRSSCQRPSHGPRWDLLDLAHRQPLARPARALWVLEDRLVPLLSLAARRYLAARSVLSAVAGGRRRTARLEPAFRRQHGGPGASARGGSKKGDPATEALGRSRGGYSTKIHLRCERGGKPIVILLTEGQRHEQPVLPTLMEQGAVKRQGRGRPRIRPDRVAGDKGYSSPTIRRYLTGSS